MNERIRRLAAAMVAGTAFVLVGCDLFVRSVRAWLDRHSFTSSIIANLLILGVTALIVDEVVARRQRRERGITVAVQALIVFGQARRAYGALAIDTGGTVTARDELRTLESMLLTASPSLFDDPDARPFLQGVEQFSAIMIRSSLSAKGTGVTDEERGQLSAGLAQVQAAAQPLVARIPARDRALFEGTS